MAYMIHPNEVKITNDNKDVFMQEAQSLGPNHVLALREQMLRQGVN